MSESRKHDPIQGEIIHEYDGIQEADNALPQMVAVHACTPRWFSRWATGSTTKEFKAGPGLAEAYYAERRARRRRRAPIPRTPS